VLVALYACFICCMWKNISLGASIMEAASDFVAGNLRVIVMPLIAYVFALAFLLFWVFTCTYIWTIGEPEFNPISPIANIVWDSKIRYTLWFFFFMLFWVTAFMICLQ